MGILVCKKHGEQSFFEVCEHYYADVLNGIKSKSYNIEIVSLRVCTSCYEKHAFKEVEKLNLDELLKFPKKEQDKIEKQLFEKYNAIHRKAFCIKCYEEAIASKKS